MVAVDLIESAVYVRRHRGVDTGAAYVVELKGDLHLKPPKFEHIFVAVITFSPFLLCKYF